ncbi:MAG: alpha/beta fold hydrolase [Acidimicrobiales bacterium]|nr:alpha/beta fold hydrolase [Acidimicrobiales bacterium]
MPTVLSRGSRGIGMLVALCTVALAIPACSGGGSDSSQSSSTSARTGDPSTTATPPEARKPEEIPTGTSFADFADVEVPAKGTARHGDLLRYQSIPYPDGDASGRRYRILYVSTTVSGEPTVVTGMASVPAGEAPAGGWKVATHAHGSTGLADDCAPSAEPDSAPSVEARFVQGVGTKHGFVVASTDYEGQGGPGRHPFLVGVSEGRSVIDAALAARQLPGVTTESERVSIVGYSQGGHAALWANQIVGDYAPDLKVVGTVAGAPASELEEMARGVAALSGGGLVAMLGGMSTSDPSADTDSLLTDTGRKVLAIFDRSCKEVPDAALLEKKLFRVDPLRTEPWIGLIRSNIPGSEPGESPVLIVHGDADTQVPTAQSADLVARMCKAGAVVERRVVPGKGHIEGAVPAYEQGFEWLDGLLSGRKPVNDCAR